MTSHKSFKKAAGFMLVAVLASRLLGLVREMLIARQFGQTGDVSAYTAAFNLPDMLYFFLSSGALSSAFIPVFTERFKTGRQKEAWQIFSIIACFMGVVLTAAVVLAWIYAKPLSVIFAVPGFATKPKLVELTVLLTRIILPCQLFFFVGGVMMATLESRQKFSARAAGPVIYNIGIILGAIFLSRWFHIAGLAIGTLIGAFAGNIAYTYYCMKKEGYEFYPSLNIRHPGVIKVARLALPVMLGLGLPQIDIIVNKWFASFVSTDAPAALNYANRLMQVPLGIFAQAAGTAILPMLAAYAAKNALDDMRSGLAYGLRAIMVESIPATIFIIVMADPLVRTIYMGGKFMPSSVNATVIPLIWYSVGIFAWAGQAIVARGFFAMQDTISPVVIGTASTLIFIPLNYYLMHSMGTGGIALATTIAISLNFLALTWYLRKRLHGLEAGRTINTIGRILVAAVVMGVVCFGIRFGMARLVGSWQLQDGDLKHPQEMAVRIRQSDTPLSRYLYSNLSDKTDRLIDDHVAFDTRTPQMRIILRDQLNTMMKDGPVYQKKTFARVELSSTAKELLDSDPTGDNLTNLNRRLIQSAYPDTIAKKGETETAVTRLLESENVRKARAQRNARGSWLLQADDIQDVPALVVELTNEEDPVSVELVSRFEPSARESLKHYASLYKRSQELPQSYMHDMNELITKEQVYSPQRFAGVTLPANLTRLVQSDPSGKKLAQANRRLIEAAYSKEVVSRPAYRVESKMGSFMTILVAMMLGGAVYFVCLRAMRVTELDYLWDGIKRRIFKRRNGSPPPDIQVDQPNIEP